MLLKVKLNFFNLGKFTLLNSSIDWILFLCIDNCSKFFAIKFSNPSIDVNLLSSKERVLRFGYSLLDKNLRLVNDKLFNVIDCNIF